MNVIGLDLSLTGSGIASSAGWCELVGRKGITTLPLAARIAAVETIANDVLSLVGRADLVVIEQTAYSRSLVGKLEISALWWLVVRSLHAREIPVATVTPGQVKRYATGSGAAGKGAIVDAVARRLPHYPTRGDDNLADAVVMAAMGSDWLGHPLTTMPAAHRAVLSKVTWPDIADRHSSEFAVEGTPA